jgi:hypothetical protein
MWASLWKTIILSMPVESAIDRLDHLEFIMPVNKHTHKLRVIKII